MPVARPKVIEIFDRERVRRNRNRAAKKFPEHDFLFRWTVDNLADRLRDVKRKFPLALQVGGRGIMHEQLTATAGVESLIVMDIAEDFLSTPLLGVQGDEEFMPLATNSCDLIVSPLSLHTINDLPGALIQMNRVLKPDGLCLAALLGGETLWELRQVMMQTDIKLRGGASPHVAPFADKQQIGALMQRARFALPVVDSDIITVTYESLHRLMHDLRGMGEGNSLKDRIAPLTREYIDEAGRLYQEKFAEPDGRIRASFEVIFLVGWAPHGSQPKPLRPGSATGRLSDALGTKEISSGIRTGRDGD